MRSLHKGGRSRVVRGEEKKRREGERILRRLEGFARCNLQFIDRKTNSYASLFYYFLALITPKYLRRSKNYLGFFKAKKSMVLTTNNRGSVDVESQNRDEEKAKLISAQQQPSNKTSPKVPLSLGPLSSCLLYSGCSMSMVLANKSLASR